MPANTQEDRTTFVGGTDAMRIMHGDWLSLYKEKVGIQPPQDMSRRFPVQLGIYTEPFHREWLAWQTGYTINTVVPFEKKIRNVPCRAKIDGYIPVDHMVELKHTGGHKSVREEALNYMPQVQFYMLVGDFKKCTFSVIGGNQEPEHCTIEPNQPYANMLMDTITTFWDHCVNRVPPTEDWVASTFRAETEEAAKIVPIDGMVSVDMSKSNSWVDHAGIYLANEEASKNFDQAKKELKELMPDNAYEATGGGIILKRSKNGSLRFSKEK